MAQELQKPTVLAYLSEGNEAVIEQVDIAGESGERLLEMGVTPGVVVKMIRRGFLGTPMQILVRGYMLTLRKHQAMQIRLQNAGV